MDILPIEKYFEQKGDRPKDVHLRLKNIPGEYKKWRARIYNLKPWKDLSKILREKAEYICQNCRNETAVACHHLEKVYYTSGKYGYFDLQRLMDVENILPVCGTCHRKMEGKQGCIEKKYHDPCGHPILNDEKECTWCNEAELIVNKKRSKKSEGKTLRDARAAAKEIMEWCHPKTKLTMEHFLRITQPYLKKNTTILDDIRNYIESLKVGKDQYNPTGDFKLLPWQVIAMVYAFGSFADMDLPKSLLITMSRKNGKSTLTAAFVIAFAKFAPQQVNAIDLTATKKGQASEVMITAIRRIIANTYPGSTSTQKGLTTPNKEWTVTKTSANYAPTMTEIFTLSSEPETADGRDPILCVVDEAAQVKDDYYRVVNTSKSARKHQCFVYISTLSENEYGWFKRTIDSVVDDLKEGKDNIGYCPLFFFVDKDEYNIHDEEMWSLTNPSLGYMQTRKQLKIAQQAAMNSPLERIEFLMKNCNMSGMTEKPRLCDPAEALAVISEVSEEKVMQMLKDYETVIGIDVGVSSGMTSVCHLTRVDMHIYAHLQNFICEDSYNNKKGKIRVLEHFVERGELIVCGKANINMQVVYDYIQRLTDDYRVEKILSDRSSGGNSISDYMKELYDDDYEEITLNAQQKKNPCNLIYESIKDHRCHTTNSELFRWELNNSGLKELPAVPYEGELPDGSHEIVRLMDSSFNGIDGVYAMVHAVTYFQENSLQSRKKGGMVNVLKAMKRMNEINAQV